MNAKQYSILLVDDEPDILEFMEYNLKKENYTVNKASNGKEAIQKAVQLKPDLIILDIMMPEMDGIETCRSLREMPEFKNTLIAFLTARNEDYSQIAGFDVGADDYITKPIKPRVLISRINALLRRVNLAMDTVAPPTTKVTQIGELQIDRDQYIITVAGQKIILPRKE
ncbi:MAG: hypothetical protein RIQ89_2404, partial [Bacteroidota bacterium]